MKIKDKQTKSTLKKEQLDDIMDYIESHLDNNVIIF
jgi:hypothetical protein